MLMEFPPMTLVVSWMITLPKTTRSLLLKNEPGNGNLLCVSSTLWLVKIITIHGSFTLLQLIILDNVEFSWTPQAQALGNKTF